MIFNCDSVQLYQLVQIGAAKPTQEEMNLVPHHLFDVVSPPREITSAAYRQLFLAELEKVPSEKPIYVVGGTGFYFLALEKGLYEIQEASEELKNQIESELQVENGPQKLFEEIQKRDPSHAQKLHINDHYRIARAVEILRCNPDKTITDLLREKEQVVGLPGRIEKIGVKWSATDLEIRIRNRTQVMLDEGLIEETKTLLAQGLKRWAPLKSVGYKETVQYLENQIPYESLHEQIAIATRQLAKKQRTWFQRDGSIKWVEGSGIL